MEHTKLRCKYCKTQPLLATVDEDGLITVQRGGMQATFADAQTAAIVCYRCGKLNLFKLTDKTPGAA